MAGGWRFADWWEDDTRKAKKVYVPESGGWIYEYRDPNGMYGHLFVPDITAWSGAIGAAFSRAQHADDPVRIVPNLDAITYLKQPIPKGT
jgi:hypothetical protein